MCERTKENRTCEWRTLRWRCAHGGLPSIKQHSPPLHETNETTSMQLPHNAITYWKGHVLHLGIDGEWIVGRSICTANGPFVDSAIAVQAQLQRRFPKLLTQTKTTNTHTQEDTMMSA